MKVFFMRLNSFRIKWRGFFVKLTLLTMPCLPTAGVADDGVPVFKCGVSREGGLSTLPSAQFLTPPPPLAPPSTVWEIWEIYVITMFSQFVLVCCAFIFAALYLRGRRHPEIRSWRPASDSWPGCVSYPLRPMLPLLLYRWGSSHGLTGLRLSTEMTQVWGFHHSGGLDR